MNITKETIEVLQEMVDMSFVMTALIDRMQSVLDADLSYNNTANLIHQNIAHRYSGYFADMIADLTLQGYDISVNYGKVPIMNKKYNTLSEVLSELEDKVFDYQNALNMCYKITMDNMDIHIGVELLDLIKDHNKIVRQIILLCNKADAYGDNNPSFDAHIKEHFWIL